ncbi:hypothetical protein RRG08_017779 [Elysia crispata]|uniref:Uncharacterized protein n=1 Tax=Elysia crispata TaxID=231223 RepID=A0AAE0YWV0_9GAST|nr:hypothetical protein RRG08_017779 [Elysia crispata]
MKTSSYSLSAIQAPAIVIHIHRKINMETPRDHRTLAFLEVARTLDVVREEEVNGKTRQSCSPHRIQSSTHSPQIRG